MTGKSCSTIAIHDSSFLVSRIHQDQDWASYKLSGVLRRSLSLQEGLLVLLECILINWF